MVLGKRGPKVLYTVLGNTITLECDSDSLPTWYFMGKKLKESHKIILRDISEQHSGHYNCHGTKRTQDTKKIFDDVIQVYVAGINDFTFFNCLPHNAFYFLFLFLQLSTTKKYSPALP